MSALPLPPGPGKGLPLVGHSLTLFRDPGGFLYDCYRKYGPIFQISLGGKPCVFLIGPEGNRFLLVNGFRHFAWRPGTGMLARYFGEALFVLDGDEHRRQRRLMQPAFHPSRFDGYAATMRQICAERVQQWGAMGRVNLFDETRRLTLEVAARILLGIEVGTRYEEYKRLFLDLLAPTMSVLGQMPFPLFSPHARALKARARAWPLLKQVVQEKRRHPGTDALSALATARDEDGTMLTEDQVIAQGLGLLFAGHETTSGMVGFALHLLAQHPDALARVRAELRSAVGQAPVTTAHLPNLPYLFLVLKETERLYPATPLGIRGVVEPFAFGGYHVPAGYLAAYSAHASHRIPAVFAQPKQFDPERFAPPREEHKRTPYALVGFGAGPRVCVGINFAQVEAAVLLVTILQQWDLEIAPDAIRPIVYLPTIHPRNPVWATVRPASQ